jgi:hypothetical protein
MLAAMTCLGQTGDRPRPKYYQFEFAVKEVDGGRVLGTRNYSSIGTRDVHIRSGDKIPIRTLKAGQSEVTFLDVGTNIDCNIVNTNGTELDLNMSVDISTAGSEIPPVVSQLKWSSSVPVVLKKPTLIYSSASASKKTQTQLEVTITPLE